jgi:hypothetical protein
MDVRDRAGNTINITLVVWGASLEGSSRSIISSVEGEAFRGQVRRSGTPIFGI